MCTVCIASLARRHSAHCVMGTAAYLLAISLFISFFIPLSIHKVMGSVEYLVILAHDPPGAQRAFCSDLGVAAVRVFTGDEAGFKINTVDEAMPSQVCLAIICLPRLLLCVMRFSFCR